MKRLGASRYGAVMENSREGTLPPVPDREWTTRTKYRADPDPSAETVMAAAFRRAIEARKIDIEEVPKIADAEAREIFQLVRWADSDGRPICPACAAERPYVLPSRVGSFSCRNSNCRRTFSLTSKTIFASRKTTFQNTLIALSASIDADMNATRLCDIMGVGYKTALSFAHRFGLRDGRRNTGRRILMSYPYMSVQSIVPGADLLSEIVRHLPPGLPQEMREDVSQELVLAVLSGDVQRTNVIAAIPSYMTQYHRMFRGKYSDLSLDAMLPGFDNRTLGDTLSGENSFDYWERH